MHRLFVAIELPAEIKGQLATISYGVPGARWVDEDQLHLTVRFIGEVDGGIFHDIKEGLEAVRVAPFSLRLKGLGFFPPRGMPRVLWVGIEKNPQLVQLRNKVESRLVRIGLTPEGRKFAPHITLARLRDTPPNKLGNFLAGNGLFETSAFAVQEFLLYSSRLTPKGAIHTVEAAYGLEEIGDNGIAGQTSEQ